MIDPTLPSPTTPIRRLAKTAWRSGPQVSSVRRSRAERAKAGLECGFVLTWIPLPTTLTLSQNVRSKFRPFQDQKRALQMPSVPTVKPSSGSPAAREGGAIRSRSATTSVSLIACQPALGWLCMKATPEFVWHALRAALARYSGSKLTLPCRLRSPFNGRRSSVTIPVVRHAPVLGRQSAKQRSSCRLPRRIGPSR